MLISHAIDCTELYRAKPDNLSDVSFITSLVEELPSNPTRVYFGSNFCANYFLSFSLNTLETILKEFHSLGLAITLVVPIFTQRALSLGVERLHDIASHFSEIIDEITVNDYGMMEEMKACGIPLNAGRLFSRDLRDIRYGSFFEQTHEPATFLGDAKRLVDAYGIKGIELDITHACVDCSNVPDGLELAFYSPYTYISTAQICPYASIGNTSDYTFEPNRPCSLQCQKLKRIVAGRNSSELIMVGKTSYFKNDRAEIRNIDHYRIIHSPLIRKAF